MQYAIDLHHVFLHQKKCQVMLDRRESIPQIKPVGSDVTRASLGRVLDMTKLCANALYIVIRDNARFREAIYSTPDLPQALGRIIKQQDFTRSHDEPHR